MPRGVPRSTLYKRWHAQKVQEKWNATHWAKKLAKANTRANLTYFERFNVMLLKKKINEAVEKEATKLRRAASKK